MRQCQVTTELFLREVSSSYFNIDFENLSPVTWIGDDDRRKILQLSEASLASGDLEKSLTLTKAALRLA